jgi:hypothetical protein
MKDKLNEEEIKLISEKAKPFFKEYWKLSLEFGDKVRILEEKMNKEIKPKTKIEFFYVDGEMVGIGAEDYSDGAWFPLIHEN